MGIVGHLSENITLNNVQVVPEAGNVISTNTDATHFTSCTGTVTIENCKFGGQGDDCTNIHNYYYSIYPEGKRKVEIRIENADLHAQWLDYPEVGDTMLVVSRKNIEQQGTYVVQQVDTSLTQWKVSITLDKELNLEKTDDWYMTNMTRLPAVRIINNTVRSHLARAFLIKSRNVVIAGNAIQNSTIAAIKLGAEVSWHESAPVENVLVEDNWISDCGYLADSNSASAITIETSGTGQTPAKSNRHIIIRNNVIESGKQNVISVKDAYDVTIANNCISGSLSPVRTENCENVTVVPF